MRLVQSKVVVAVGAVIAALALCAPAAPAASPPPYLGGTTFSCLPANGKSTRVGEDVVCRLTVISSDWVNATADITIPSATVFDPTLPSNAFATLDDPLAPTVAHYGPTTLGLLSPWTPKAVAMQLHIPLTATAGTPIAPVATLHTDLAPDVILTATPAASVMPPPPDLSPSTLTCQDGTPPAPLRSGDRIDCSIQLQDIAGLEDAANVNVQAIIPGPLTWTPGGNGSHPGVYVVWGPADLPAGVPSGPPVVMPLTYSALTPLGIGNAAYSTTAFVTYEGAQSHEKGSVVLTSAALTTAPEPAVLAASRLLCADHDGGQLLPGDAIDCTLTVDDAAGYEDATGLTAVAPAPANAVTATGAPVTFGTAALGALASGTSKSVAYQLHVAAGTPGGATITPTATVTGASTPSGKPLSFALTANTLIVGAVRAPTPAAPTQDTPQPVVAAAAAPAAATPAKASRICASRRVVVVRVRPPRGHQWRSVKLQFPGHTVTAKRWRKTVYFRARLVFQGLPKGPLLVRITGRTTTGQTIHRARHYRLCTKRGAR